jgi:hypothetical protein
MADLKRPKVRPNWPRRGNALVNEVANIINGCAYSFTRNAGTCERLNGSLRKVPVGTGICPFNRPGEDPSSSLRPFVDAPWPVVDF